MITIPDICMPIVRNVRTKEERDMLAEEMSELEATLFRSGQEAFEKVLSTRLSERMASAMRDILGRQEFKNNSENLRIFFHDVKNVLDTFVPLRLTIAVKPSEEMIDRLHEWVQKNLGIGVILDIGYDGSIRGGARIIFNGRYREMTLAQMITDTLAKEKTTVMGMIK